MSVQCDIHGVVSEKRFQCPLLKAFKSGFHEVISEKRSRSRSDQNGPFPRPSTALHEVRFRAFHEVRFRIFIPR
jgi:hypothetical protein